MLLAMRAPVEAGPVGPAPAAPPRPADPEGAAGLRLRWAGPRPVEKAREMSGTLKAAAGCLTFGIVPPRRRRRQCQVAVPAPGAVPAWRQSTAPRQWNLVTSDLTAAFPRRPPHETNRRLPPAPMNRRNHLPPATVADSLQLQTSEGVIPFR